MLNISCLHSAESNIAVFEAARRDLKRDDIMLRHRVRADLLAAAEKAGGATEAVLERTAAELRTLGQKAAAVLLTCSTLGPAAERAGRGLAVPVLRVDQALAEAAVARGGIVIVLCALGSTIASTRAVFERAAMATEAAVEIRLVPDAWDAFMAGDQQRYWRLVAEAADIAAVEGTVALAQASMAGAARLCRELPAPLTSPAAGLAAAIAAAQRTVGNAPAPS